MNILLNFSDLKPYKPLSKESFKIDKFFKYNSLEEFKNKFARSKNIEHSINLTSLNLNNNDYNTNSDTKSIYNLQKINNKLYVGEKINKKNELLKQKKDIRNKKIESTKCNTKEQKIKELSNVYPGKYTINYSLVEKKVNSPILKKEITLKSNAYYINSKVDNSTFPKIKESKDNKLNKINKFNTNKLLNHTSSNFKNNNILNRLPNEKIGKSNSNNYKNISLNKLKKNPNIKNNIKKFENNSSFLIRNNNKKPILNDKLKDILNSNNKYLNNYDFRIKYNNNHNNDSFEFTKFKQNKSYANNFNIIDHYILKPNNKQRDFKSIIGREEKINRNLCPEATYYNPSYNYIRSNKKLVMPFDNKQVAVIKRYKFRKLDNLNIISNNNNSNISNNNLIADYIKKKELGYNIRENKFIDGSLQFKKDF